jgi:hypothetical protein
MGGVTGVVEPSSNGKEAGVAGAQVGGKASSLVSNNSVFRDTCMALGLDSTVPVGFPHGAEGGRIRLEALILVQAEGYPPSIPIQLLKVCKEMEVVRYEKGLLDEDDVPAAELLGGESSAAGYG